MVAMRRTPKIRFKAIVSIVDRTRGRNIRTKEPAMGANRQVIFRPTLGLSSLLCTCPIMVRSLLHLIFRKELINLLIGSRPVVASRFIHGHQAEQCYGVFCDKPAARVLGIPGVLTTDIGRPLAPEVITLL